MADDQAGELATEADPLDMKYDIFLEHSSKDGEVAKMILDRLESNEYGMRCFGADRDVLPGERIIRKTTEAAFQSRYILVLISQAFLNSERHLILETQNVLESMHERGQRVVIPILVDVDDSKVPQALTGLNHLTWGEDNFWERMKRRMSGQFHSHTSLGTSKCAAEFASNHEIFCQRSISFARKSCSLTNETVQFNFSNADLTWTWLKNELDG